MSSHSATEYAAVSAPQSTGMSAGQYLTFLLDREIYGLPIKTVQEIRAYSRPTPIDGYPREIKGVIDLRGQAVQVIDLHESLHSRATTVTESTVIVVVGYDDLLFGAIADSVRDVLDISAQAIKSVPQIGLSKGQGAIAGLATVEKQMVILLNWANLMKNL
jgi:purine-binding chemotaxis protein CheW